ncbi:MAG: nucleotidyl transferase AbiEii/AbiGii toxin family protein, partial [Candidatus Brocadiia bacterium]
MNADGLSNVPASVRQRLLNRIRETGEASNFVWSRYATERLLYRLSASEHAEHFVLKGAALFLVWTGEPHRPTMDVDLLADGEDSDEHLESVFRDLCRADVVPDGLQFDESSVAAVPIRGGQEYGGFRVKLTAYLGKSPVRITVDVGFGDAVTPAAQRITYPTLLDFPAPVLRACPRETVVAEKLHAMVVLGMINSRMKDFYDLYVLASGFAYRGSTLCQAVRATFDGRTTDLPAEPPVALTAEFAEDATKQRQWRAFLSRAGIDDAPAELSATVAALAEFLDPV